MEILKTASVVHWDFVLVVLELKFLDKKILEVLPARFLEQVFAILLEKQAVVESISPEVNLEEGAANLVLQ